MILQRLSEHYDRLIGHRETSMQLARPGFSWQKISFCVVLNADGQLQSFQSLLESAGKRPIPRQMLVPGETKPSGSGINPGLLWDNSAYMLGFKAGDTTPKRTRESFEAFRKRHLEMRPQINHPWFEAVCSFLKTWSPEQAGEYSGDLKEVIQNFGVFRIAGEQRFVHEVVGPGGEIEASPRLGTCLVTGCEGAAIARLHEPKIKGVNGSQGVGALLVSFNAAAYESYGKNQSYNAPVSSEAVFKYTNALNYLLRQDERRILLGDATFVFWAEKASEVEEFFSDLFGNARSVGEGEGAAEDRERLRQTRQFLTQLRDGTAATDAITDENETRIFI